MRKVAMLTGKWGEAMYYVLGHPTTKPKGYDPMTEVEFAWGRDKSTTKTRYNLTPLTTNGENVHYKFLLSVGKTLFCDDSLKM